MIETPLISEALLETWLEKYPSLLAGHQIDPSAPRRWLLVEGECGVPSEEGGGGRFSIDHLFLDQNAIPTIVEVKRSANTQIRREVVGQMMVTRPTQSSIGLLSESEKDSQKPMGWLPMKCLTSS